MSQTNQSQLKFMNEIFIRDENIQMLKNFIRR